jgi:hypothetical protein
MDYLADDRAQELRYKDSPPPQWNAHSVEYLVQHMPHVPSYASDLRLHQAVASRVLTGGYFMEFGVDSGRSIRHWAELFPGETIWGFDGFTGLYEAWNGFPVGHFARKELPEVPDNVQLVVGRFNDSLPAWTNAHPDWQDAQPGWASLIHIDCDTYPATKEVFKYIAPYIVPGTIIVFDEYWNHDTWLQDEYLAWQEEGIPYEYIGRVHGGNYQPVAVRVK